MICYEFGTNYIKEIHKGISWKEKTDDFPIRHTHDFWEFFIVQQGSFEHETKAGIDILSTGDSVLIPPGEMHALKARSDVTRHLNITISDPVFKEKCSDLSSSLYDEFLSHPPTKIKFSLERMKKIEKHLQGILLSIKDSEKDVLSALTLFNIIEPIHDYYAKESSTMPEWFKKLLIQCNSIEHLSWKPHDACEAANYSQTHINRAFKKFYNTTLVDYLTEIKMSNAIVFLTNSDMSLSNIANALGYSSISHFSHVFKKNYDVSPYKYKLTFRKQLMEKEQ